MQATVVLVAVEQTATGDAERNRTFVSALKGRRLDLLTTAPYNMETLFIFLTIALPVAAHRYMVQGFTETFRVPNQKKLLHTI